MVDKAAAVTSVNRRRFFIFSALPFSKKQAMMRSTISTHFPRALKRDITKNVPSQQTRSGLKSSRVSGWVRGFGMLPDKLYNVHFDKNDSIVPCLPIFSYAKIFF